jgi:hypothetical protein
VRNDGRGARNPAGGHRSSYADTETIGFVDADAQRAPVLLASSYAFSTTPLEAKVASPREAHRLARL